MNWYELARNPRAISEVYHEVPSLQEVHLNEVILSRDGPTMFFVIDLPRQPDRPPPRWKLQGVTHVQVQLDFWVLELMELACWSGKQRADIALEPTPERQLAVSVRSPSWKIQARAMTFSITLLKSTGPTEKG